MNCRKFERDLPDWMAGRLPDEKALLMQAHHAACPRCQQATRDEQALRRTWQELPPAADIPAIWPRLATRLDVLQPKSRLAPFRFLALGGTAVTACLLGLFLWKVTLSAPPDLTGPLTVADAKPADERHIVMLISEVQQLPDEETDTFLRETQQERQAQRRLLRKEKR